jgi:hypothetical protein
MSFVYTWKKRFSYFGGITDHITIKLEFYELHVRLIRYCLT